MIANTFDRAEATASRVADRHFGEPIRVIGTRAGANSRARADPKRLPFMTTGIYSGKAMTDSKAGEYVDKVSKDSQVSFDLRSLVWTIEQGDWIHRPKTGVTYRVKRLLPDGQGRIDLDLHVV